MTQRHDTRENIATVIMAAGKGTRMKNPDKAKVMYELSGKPMIHYVVDLAQSLRAERIIAIVGFQRESVMEYVRASHPSVEFVVQEPQRGTGHAVLQAESVLKDFSGDVLVLSGDVPLLKRETIDELMQIQRERGAVASILTVELNDPTGYGRIIRGPDGSVEKIVEQRDASPQEREVKEINSGIYLFNAEKLYDGLNHISPHNVQQEYYLTDVFEYFWRHHWTVAACKASHVDEIQGINTLEQLEQAEDILNARHKR